MRDTNAFFLLKISPYASSPAEIKVAQDDARFDERASDSVLQNAADALSSPIPRLQAEVSYLWCEPHTEDNKLFDGVESALDYENLRQVAKNIAMPALGRANMAALFCGRKDIGELIGVEDALEDLISAQKEINVETISKIINEARKHSKFKSVDGAYIEDALKKLRAENHIDAAINAIRSAPHPGKLAASLAEKWRVHKTQSGNFVTELIRDKYKSFVLPVVRPLEDEINSASDELRENPRDEESLRCIEEKLLEWDEYQQPIQLVEEQKGFDDPHSHEMCMKLIELYRYLHKEKDETEVSFRISKVLSKVFEELPKMSEILGSDIGVLEKIIYSKNTQENIREKMEAFEKSIEKLNNARTERQAKENAVEFIRAFESLLDNPDAVAAEGLWGYARKTAIDAHNKHNYSMVSMFLIEKLFILAKTHDAPVKIGWTLTKDLESIKFITSRKHNEEESTEESTSIWRTIIVVIVIIGIISFFR